MLNLFTDDILRNPFAFYDQIRSTSPVLYSPQGDLWMLFDYENVKRALNDNETFSSSAGPTGDKPLEWLIFLDPPRHTKLRALISKAFTPRSIVLLEPRIRELSRQLLNQSIERGAMDLVSDFSVPLPLMVIAEMLGIPSADWPRYRHWSDAILGLAGTVSGGEEKIRAATVYRQATVEMAEYLTDLLSARRTAPADDLLTRLLTAEVDGERLTEKELLNFFQLLLLAGHETTTNLINNAVISLLDHPDQLALLRANPELISTAIEEVLRYRSPVQAVFRAGRRDIEIGDQIIPANKLIILFIGAANRDPRQFIDADKFDITREPNPHVAFGYGAHFCLGAALSRLEARIALSDLLERLTGLELAGDQPWPPRQAFHIHGPSRLPIRFQPGQSVMA